MRFGAHKAQHQCEYDRNGRPADLCFEKECMRPKAKTGDVAVANREQTQSAGKWTATARITRFRRTRKA
jgi:hypothetical protein